MRDNTLSHPLDLADDAAVTDLFAEEVSSAEQLQLCCENCVSTFSTVACACNGSTLACYNCLSCECS